jgi:hypothetical protein
MVGAKYLIRGDEFKFLSILRNEDDISSAFGD